MRTILSILALTPIFISGCVLARTTVQPTTPTEAPTPLPGNEIYFRSEEYHLEVMLPPDWGAVEGPQYLAKPFLGWVAFNSWGEPGFWITEVEEETDAGARHSYIPMDILKRLPAEGAYIVLIDQAGGPPFMEEDYGPERELTGLADLWRNRDCRKEGETIGFKMMNFHKWGRFMRLEVYCAPQVTDETAAQVNSLLASWRFDAIPAGDVGWASVAARELLPASVEPNLFPYLTDGPDLSSSQRDEIVRLTQSEKPAEDRVIITFMYRWNESPQTTTSWDCPSDRCHWWRTEARPDGEVVLVEEGGAPLPEEKPAYADGNDWLLLISSRQGYPAIYASRPDGSRSVKLMDDLSGILSAALSPDGTRIAFSANSPSDGAWDIFVMNVDGTSLVNLTEGMWNEEIESPTTDAFPSWSPDGRRLAFTSDGDIFVIDADGSGLVRLADHPRWDSHPCWSPDGLQIAFFSERGGSPDIYLIEPDGSNLRQLTDDPGAESPPIWSPDGSKIAFISDQEGNGEIYVMDADGSNQVNLTRYPSEDSAPLWSPDGSRLIFTSDRDGQLKNYLMNADGSDQAQMPGALSEGSIVSWGESAALTSLSMLEHSPTVTPAPTAVLNTEQSKMLALDTLLEFFESLHAQEYERAAELYGGSYEALMDWNPTVPPKDHKALLKNACEFTLQCLRVRSAALQVQIGSDEFFFLVEFENEDGSLFVRGPCCGASETDMPPEWQFPYTVKRIEGQFRVMELPVYVP